MVDPVGEIFYYIFELFYMLWPAKKDRWVIPIAIGLSVLIITFVALAVFFDVGRANWIQTIGGPARLVDGDTVVFVGILFAMALLLGAALVLSFLHWKDWKAQKAGQGDGPVYLKKAKPLDGLLRDHPSQRKTDDSPLLWLPRLSRWPIVLGAIAATLLAFTATTLFLNSREGVQHKTKEVVIIRGTKPDEPISGIRLSDRLHHKAHDGTATSDSGSSGGSNNSSGPPIEVIDGDTVRMNGERYRLVGFDTPERGDKARCDDERQRAEKATQRLRSLISAGSPRLTRVACACRPGDEGTSRCNYGRLCGVLTVGGRDVGQILIGEGLAHPYVCSGTSCPKRQPWCDGR